MATTNKGNEPKTLREKLIRERKDRHFREKFGITNFEAAYDAYLETGETNVSLNVQLADEVGILQLLRKEKSKYLADITQQMKWVFPFSVLGVILLLFPVIRSYVFHYHDGEWLDIGAKTVFTLLAFATISSLCMIPTRSKLLRQLRAIA